MRIAYTFRNVDSSDAIKQYAETKIGKLSKYLRSNFAAEVTVSIERHLQKVDIAVTADGGARFSATEESEDLYASIDVAMDKIGRQVRDRKDTENSRRRGSSAGLGQQPIDEA